MNKNQTPDFIIGDQVPVSNRQFVFGCAMAVIVITVLLCWLLPVAWPWRAAIAISGVLVLGVLVVATTRRTEHHIKGDPEP